MTQKTLKDLRGRFTLAENSYLDALALEGELPKCNYPNNGVPELRGDLPPASIEDIFGIGVKPE